MEYGINDWRNAIFDDENLSPMAKLIALALARYYRPTKETYPSYAVLMDATGIKSKHTVISAVRELTEAGYITIKHKKIKRLSALANTYVFNGVDDGANNGASNGASDGALNAPQIREEEKKEKDIIINNNIQKERFKAPTLDEVKTYITEKNLIVDADKFFNYFTVGNWKDSLGKPVKNWKQKLITWDTKSRTERTLKAAKPLLTGVKSLTYGEDIPL